MTEKFWTFKWTMKKKYVFFFFFFVKIVFGDLKMDYMHKKHQLFTFGGEKPPLLTNEFSNIENSKKFTTFFRF